MAPTPPHGEYFREHFGEDAEVFVVFNGTGANCLSLEALTHSFHAVICAASAHIYTDECGAPEKFTGCKLIPIPTPDGKLTVELIRHAYHGIGDEHHVQPKVISITQATEMGTIYRAEEIQAIARFAREHDLYLHMDEPASPTPPPHWAKACGKRPATWASMYSPSVERKTESWAAKPWSSSIRNWRRIFCSAANNRCSSLRKCALSPRSWAHC
jgi:hypothetical protein